MVQNGSEGKGWRIGVEELGRGLGSCDQLDWVEKTRWSPVCHFRPRWDDDDDDNENSFQQENKRMRETGTLVNFSSQVLTSFWTTRPYISKLQHWHKSCINNTCSIIMKVGQEFHKLVLVFHQDFLYWWSFIWICNKYLQYKSMLSVTKSFVITAPCHKAWHFLTVKALCTKISSFVWTL